jgi:hypothetical protein
MGTCEVCGNSYDKAFRLLWEERHTFSTALSVQSMPWRRLANHCGCRILGTVRRTNTGVFSFAVRFAPGRKGSPAFGTPAS